MSSNLLSETALKLTLGVFVVTQVSQPLLAREPNSQSPIVVRSGDTSLDVTIGGTPIVVIEAPDEDGTSHNVFSRFDVNSEGVIINNSMDVAQSVLGGFVLGNPNLIAEGREADLVIAEVLGGNRSTLAGALEMLGGDAAFILANEAGITCDGCGFVNMPNVTLSTGRVQFGADGKYSGLLVNRGDVKVEGAGLLGGNVDYFDIVSLTSEINANLYAKDLQISAGAAEYDTRLRTARSLGQQTSGIAVDSSLLGGMYANRIRLVGNDLGMGVNLRGDVASLESDVDIDVGGDIATGRVQAAQNLSLTSRGGNINVAGNNYAGGDAGLDAAGNVVIESSFVGAAGNVHVAAGGSVSAVNGAIYAGLDREGGLTGDGVLALTAGQSIDLQSARFLAAGSVDIEAQDIVADGASVVGGDSLAVTASNNVQSQGLFSSTKGLTISGGKLVALNNVQSGGDLNITGEDIALSGEVVGMTSATLTAQNQVQLGEEAGLLTNGAVTINGASLDNAGGVLGVAAVAVNTTGDLNNSGSLATGGTASLNAGGDFTSAGNISAQSAITIDAVNSVVGGTIVSDEAISLTTGDLNLAGTISAGGALDVDNSGTLQTGADSQLFAKGDLAIASGRDVLLGGEVFAGGDLDIDSAHSLTVSAVTQVVGSASLDAETVAVSGEIVANEAVTLTSDNDITLSGSLGSGGAVTLDAAGAIDAAQSQQLLAGGDLTLTSDTDISLGGVSSSGGQANIGAADNLTLSGNLSASDALTLTAQDALLQTAGLLESGGDLSLTASDINLEGDILSLQDVAITSDVLGIGSDANIQAVGDISADIVGALTSEGNVLSESGIALTSGGDAMLGGSIQAGADLNVSAQNIDVSGSMLALGDLELLTAGDIEVDGSLASAGSLDLAANNIAFAAGSFAQSEGDLTASFANLTQDGDWISGGSISVIGDMLEAAGTFSAISDITLDLAGAINLAEGSGLGANGNVAITSESFANAGSISALGSLDVDAVSGLNIASTGALLSNGAQSLSAGTSIDNQGVISANGALLLEAPDNITSTGQIASGAAVTLTSNALDLSGTLNALGDITLSGSERVAIAAQIGTDGELIIDTSELTSAAASDVTAGQAIRLTADDITLDGNWVSGGVFDVLGDELTIAGSLGAVGDMRLIATSSLDHQGELISEGNLQLTAPVLNLDGSVLAVSDLSIDSDALTIGSNAAIRTAALLELSSQNALTLDGFWAGGTGVNISSDAAITLIGRLESGGLTNLEAADQLDISGSLLSVDDATLSGADITVSGTIESAGNASLTSQQGSQLGDIELSGVLIANGDIALVSAQADISGGISSGAELSVTADRIDIGETGQLVGDTVNINSAASITNAGVVFAEVELALEAGTSLINTGNLEGRGTASLEADIITLDGTANFESDVVIDAISRIDLTGQLASNGALSLTSQIIQSHEGSALAGYGDTALAASERLDLAGEHFSAGTFMLSAPDMDLSGVLVSDGDLTVTADNSLSVDGTLYSAANLAAQAQDIMLGGIAAADGNLSLASDRLSALAGSTIQSGANISVVTNEEQSHAGLISATGTLDLTSGTSLSLAGQIEAQDDIALNAANLISGDGTILTGSGIGITANSLDWVGVIEAQGTANIDLEEGLDLAGNILANGSIIIAADTANVDGLLVSDDGVQLSARTLDLTGAISAGGVLDLDIASDLLTGVQARIFSGTAATIDAASFTHQGQLSAADDLTLTLGGTLTNSGLIESGGDALLTAAGDVDLSGQLYAVGDLSLQAVDVDISGAIGSNGALAIAADQLAVDGSISSLGASAITIAGSATTGVDSEILSGSSLSITAGEDIAIGGTAFAEQDIMFEAGEALLAGGVVQSNGATTLVADSLNFAGIISAAGDIAIETGAIDGAGTLVSEGALSIDAVSANFTSTSAISAEDGLDIQLTGDLVQAGYLGSNGNLTAAFDNGQLNGSVFAGGDLAMEAIASLIQSGDWTALGAIELTSGGDASFAGSLFAGETLDISAERLSALNSSEITALETISFASVEALTLGGAIGTNSDLLITGGQQVDLGGSLTAGGLITLTAGTTLASDADISSDGGISLTAGSAVIDGALSSAQSIVLTSNSGAMTLSGEVLSSDAISIDSAGLLDASGVVQSEGALSLAADSADISGQIIGLAGLTADVAQGFNVGADGQLASLEDITLDAGAFDNLGTVEALGELDIITASNLANAGLILASEQLSIRSSGRLTNTGSIAGEGDVAISSTGALTQNGLLRSSAALDVTGLANAVLDGTIYGEAGLSLDIAGDITAGADSLFITPGALDIISGGAVSLTGLLDAGGTLSIEAVDALEIAESIQSVGNVTLDAGAINLAGNLYSQGLAQLTASGNVDLSGTISTNGGIELSGAHIILGTDASALTNGNFSANADQLTSQGLISATGSASIDADVTALAGRIEAGGLINLAAATSLTQSGEIESGTGITATGGDLTFGGSLISNGALSLDADGNLQFGDSAALASVGAASLSGQNVALGGTIQSQSNVDIAALTDISGITDIVSDGSIALVAGSYNAAQGNLFASDNISISGGSVDLDMAATALGTLGITSTSGDMDLAGVFQSVGAINLNSAGAIAFASTSNFSDQNVIYSQATTALDAGTTVTNAGTIAADGNLSVAAPGLLTNSGTLSGESLIFNVGDLVSTGTLISQEDFNLTADILSISGGLVSGGDINLRSLIGDLSVDAELSATNLSLISDNGGINISSVSALSAAEQISLSALDDILISGSISAGELLTIASTAGDLDVAETGDISSGGTATLSADGLLSNAGFLASAGAFVLEADQIETANIVSNSDVTLRAVNDIAITGQIDSLTAITAASELGSVNISDQGRLIAADEINVYAADNGNITSAGVIVAGYSEDANGGASYGGDVTLGAGTLALGGFIGGSDVTLEGNTLDLTGTLLAEGGLSFTGDSLDIGDTGYLYSNNALNLTLTHLDNQGNLISDGAIALTGGGNWSNAGTIAATSLDLTTSGNMTSTGTLHSTSDLNLSSAALSFGAGSQTIALGNLEIDAASAEILGQAVSAGAIDIDSLGALTVGADGIVDAGTTLAINAGGNGVIDGTLVADGTIALDMGGALAIDGRIISFDGSGAAGSIALEANSITLGGLVQSASGAALTSAQGDISITGQLSGGGSLSLDAGTADISIGDAGIVYAGETLDLTALNITNDGVLNAIGALALTSVNGTIRNRGQIFSNADVALNAGSGLLDLGGTLNGANVAFNAANFAVSGDLFANEDLTLIGLSGAATTLDVTGQITALENLTIDLSSSSSSTVSLTGDASTDYTLYAGEILAIDALGNVTADALLIGTDAVNISTDGGLNLAGSAESNGDVTLEFASGDIAGRVISGGSVDLTGTDLEIGGAIQATQNITAAFSGDLLLAENALILTDQDITINIGQAFTGNGTISAGNDAAISADSVTIASTGLVITNNNLELISRSASQTSIINGELSAQNALTLTSGAGLDIGGRIFSGNSATINAVGDIRLTNVDALISASNLIDIGTSSGSLEIAGILQSGDQISLDTGSGSGTITIADTGLIQSVGNARTIALDSSDGSAANIVITSLNQIINNGTIATDGSSFIASEQAGIAFGANSALTTGTEAILRAESSGIDLTAALASGNIHATSLAIYQQDAFINDGTYSSPYNLLISASSIENSGLLGAEGNLSLITPGDITNTGTIYSGYNLTLDSDGDLLNDEGLILAFGNIDIDAANVTNLSATIESLSGSIDITTGNLTNKIKTLVISTDNGDGSDPEYRLDTLVENSGESRIIAAQNIYVDASGDILNQNSSILAGGDISLTANIVNNVGDKIYNTRTGYTGEFGICLVPNQLTGGGGCAEPEFWSAGQGSLPSRFPNLEDLASGNVTYCGRQYTRGCVFNNTIERGVIDNSTYLPGLIQAGGTLSITANQLGNGTYVDASGEIIPASTAPGIAGATEITPGVPDNVATAPTNVTVPSSSVGTGGSAGSSSDSSVTRGTQQYDEEQALLVGGEAGGIQSPPGSVDLGGFSSELTTSSVDTVGTGSVGGASGNSVAVSDPDNVTADVSSLDKVTLPYPVSWDPSRGDKSLTLDDVSVSDVTVTDGSLGTALDDVDVSLTNPTSLTTVSVTIGEETNLPGAIQTGEDGFGGADLSDAILGTNVDPSLSIDDITENTGSGEGAGELTNTGDVSDALGGQLTPDGIGNGAEVLTALAISSIADFDQLQSGFLFGFLDRYGLAPQESGLGFSGENTLFSFNNASDAGVLFSTNPGFGSTAGFYDSDYFFDALDVDRATNFTRLGDGFFESQFIAEQVRTATNQAQLPQYGSPLEQAQGLMQSAVDQQESLGLELGVELTAEQLAALNTSIVWWVTGEVAGQEVLIPVVYLAAADQKIIEDGAVLAGNNVVANIAGSLENTGTIAANNIASLSATNITNSDGGSIVGSTVILEATQDIISHNASIEADNASITAERDFIMSPEMAHSVETDNRSWRDGDRYDNSTTTRTEIAGISTLNVTNNLEVTTGANFEATAAEITVGNNAKFTVGGDAIFDGVETSTTTDESWKTDKKTHGTSSITSSDYVGTLIQVEGNLEMDVGGHTLAEGSDITVGSNFVFDSQDGITIRSAETSYSDQLDERAGKRNWETRDITGTTNHLSSIQADGNFIATTDENFILSGGSVDAGGLAAVTAQNIEISGVRDTQAGTVTTKHKKKGLLSSTVTTTSSEFDTQAVVQSTLSGSTVALSADEDVSILASNVVADDRLEIDAGGNVTIGALIEENHSVDETKFKKSGISINTSSLFLGVANNRNETTTDSTTNIGSMVGSVDGDVSITAGESLLVQGSQIVAPGGIDLAASDITIEHNLDVVDTESESQSSSFGLSIGVESPVLGSVTNARAATEIAASSDNDRVRAVAAAGAALGAYNAYDTVEQGNASAALSISLGVSSSRSEDSSHDETVIGSLVSGGDVTLVATGAGEGSTIDITGSIVEATNDLTLGADGAISITSAEENDTQSGSSSSSGMSVGTSIGVFGDNGSGSPTVDFAFNSSSSEYEQASTTHIESVLSANNQLTITTPDALTIEGGILEGDRVELDVGSLSITSEQDTSTYDSSNESVGLNASFNLSGALEEVGVNIGSGSQTGEFASVNEQSGIFAGEGGYEIQVDDATELNGAVIASEAEAAQNRLETGSLSMTDIENREEWEASQSNFSLTYDMSGTGGVIGGLSASPPTAMGASGSQEGTTFSAIEAGTILVGGEDRSNDPTINRDTEGANDGALEQEFTDEQRQEIADGFAASRILSAETGTFLANRAKEADEAAKLEAEALCGCKVNPKTLKPLLDSDGNRLELSSAQVQKRIDDSSALRDRSNGYEPGGLKRQILTGLSAAASGDVTGSALGLLQDYATNVLQQFAARKVGENKDNLDDGVRALLHGLIGCAAGVAGSGSCEAGAAAQGGTALLASALKPPKDATQAEENAYSNLIQTLVGAIASAAGVEGSELATVIASAQAEVENNGIGVGTARPIIANVPCKPAECDKAWKEFFQTKDGKRLLRAARNNEKTARDCAQGTTVSCPGVNRRYEQFLMEELEAKTGNRADARHFYDKIRNKGANGEAYSEADLNADIKALNVDKINNSSGISEAQKEILVTALENGDIKAQDVRNRISSVAAANLNNHFQAKMDLSSSNPNFRELSPAEQSQIAQLSFSSSILAERLIDADPAVRAAVLAELMTSENTGSFSADLFDDNILAAIAGDEVAIDWYLMRVRDEEERKGNAPRTGMFDEAIAAEIEAGKQRGIQARLDADEEAERKRKTGLYTEEQIESTRKAAYRISYIIDNIDEQVHGILQLGGDFTVNPATVAEDVARPLIEGADRVFLSQTDIEGYFRGRPEAYAAYLAAPIEEQAKIEAGIITTAGEYVIGGGIGTRLLRGGVPSRTPNSNGSNRPNGNNDGDGQGGAAGSAGTICSFHGDTLVLTDGGLTPIRDVTTSMSVWSRNPETGAMAMKPVQAQYSNPYEETISVSIRKVGNDNAKAGAVQTIVSNRIHPYFVQTTRRATNSEGHDYQGPITNGKWVDAGDLLAGDRLLNNDVTWSQVVSVKAEEKPLTAYNLTVSDFHTYFVSGSNASNIDAASVWVHNNCFDFDEFELLHSRDTIISSNKSSYDYWSAQRPNDIVDDLLNGSEKILVDESGKVWNGNTRLLALQDMGYDISQLITRLNTRDHLK